MKTTAVFCAISLALFCPANAQSNVRSLGAVGDGKQDDTEAIQRALEAGHPDLYFPKGTYRITRPLRVELSRLGFSAIRGEGTASLRMEGAGPALRLVGTHGGTASPPTVQAQVWERERTPVVSGLEIVGAHPEADGIEVEGTMQLILDKVVVREARHGIHLVKRNRNVLIANSHIYHNSGIGVFYDEVNLHQSNVSNCHISYNGGGGVVSRGGEVRNLQIGTCDIEANHAPQGPPTANILLDSTGGSIAEVAITGCTVQHTHKAPGSANIRILGAGRDAGLEKRTGNALTREGHVTIGNNVFSDVQTNVEIRRARGVTITGNTFWEGFEHDLFVEESSHVVVASNNFDRNPRYRVNGFLDAECNGVVFRNSSESQFQGNVVSGVWRKPGAVHLSGCRRMVVAANSIVDSDGVGLLLENLSHSVVHGNLVRDDRTGAERRSTAPLEVRGGAQNLIQANLLENP